ncbi:hypothetical protein CWE22_05455 [Pseudidiomarina aestuarii]|uniref:histidine kinase n=1 Tax=Pseudidiomarina aestuarii TaxID=624146 RepID=A0A7Z7EU25_9GAMM|nr:PAS domain-containing sensor histidine kinase [Pseudidiomarina aestuarii]RUO41605.1 hypothetical protein CWE22_05455 [Pseudidiomarina aestuarii]
MSEPLDYEQLFLQTPTLLLILEPREFRIVAASNSFLKATMREREDLIGRLLFEAYPADPDDATSQLGTQTIAESLNKVVRTGQPDTMNAVRYPIERPQSEGGGFVERYWQVTNSPVFDSQGQVAYILHSPKDVTAQMLAFDQAESVSVQLRHTLESMSDAFIMLDEDWNFTFVNSQAEKLLMREADDLIGCSMWDEFPEAVGSEFETSYRRAVESGETVRFTDYFVPLDFWVQIDAYPSPEGLAVYFRDVSAERRAEQTLKRAKERFDLVTRATNDVIWDWDVAANVLWWSEAYTERFGHPRRDEGDDPDESWVQHIFAEDREQVVEGYYAAMHDKNCSHWNHDYRFVRADGSVAFVNDRCYIARDAKGNAVRLIGSILDVTERRELDERLYQSQKMEAVGQLTGGIAHDFNNLLTVILGNAELISEQLPNDHALKPLADMTVSASERGAELTNRLLAFARRQPLEPKPTQLNELLHGMLPLLKRTVAEGVEVALLTESSLWLADIDPAQFESAILNLSINARDAMSEGGAPASGKLTIESRNVKLDEDYSSAHGDVVAGDYVLVSVSDTGTGMTPEVIQHAFEPFFTTKDRGKGSGLGLSMVYGYVKQSNGHIKIYSELQHGTTIKLYLPRAVAAADEVVAPAAAAEPEGGRERILIVEDDALVRQHVIIQLAALGYDIEAASSGQEALSMLEQERFDLLFTDVVMPGGMNGPQLAAEAQRLYPDMKILFTSGYTENAIVHHGRLDAGVHLLSKPYRRQELASKVREVLLAP